MRYVQDELKIIKNIIRDLEYDIKKARQEATYKEGVVKKLKKEVTILKRALKILKSRRLDD